MLTRIMFKSIPRSPFIGDPRDGYVDGWRWCFWLSVCRIQCMPMIDWLATYHHVAIICLLVRPQCVGHLWPTWPLTVYPLATCCHMIMCLSYHPLPITSPLIFWSLGHKTVRGFMFDLSIGYHRNMHSEYTFELSMHHQNMHSTFELLKYIFDSYQMAWLWALHLRSKQCVGSMTSNMWNI